MTIGVTAATGQLGRLVIEQLLETQPAENFVAIVRDPQKAADLAKRGVTVRQAVYEDVAALRTALAGVDRLLLVSGPEVGSRLTQHGNVITAAVDAGVGFLAYTSASHADDSPLPVVPDHRATEALIRASGLHFSLLRNNWYSEGYRATVEKARETGVIEGAAGDGRVASASRQDFAEAAAAVLTGNGHDNTVYELAGDTAWNFPELATIVSEITGRPVEYRNLSVEDYTASLAANGLPADIAEFVAAIDGAIAVGALADASGDLSRLIGRATTPVSETLR